MRHEWLRMLSHNIRDHYRCGRGTRSPVAAFIETSSFTVGRVLGQNGTAVPTLAAAHARTAPSFQSAHRGKAGDDLCLDRAEAQFLASAQHGLGCCDLAGKARCSEE